MDDCDLHDIDPVHVRNWIRHGAIHSTTVAWYRQNKKEHSLGNTHSSLGTRFSTAFLQILLASSSETAC